MRVAKIEFLNFFDFEIWHTKVWFFVLFFVFVCHHGTEFGDNCSTILAFFAPGNEVNDVSSSWKMEVPL
jgi:hypothetical protein